MFVGDSAYRRCGEFPEIFQQATPLINDIRRVGDSLYQQCSESATPLIVDSDESIFDHNISANLSPGCVF